MLSLACSPGLVSPSHGAHQLGFWRKEALEVRTSCHSLVQSSDLRHGLDGDGQRPVPAHAQRVALLGSHLGPRGQAYSSEAWAGRQGCERWCRAGLVEGGGINNAMFWAPWHSVTFPLTGPWQAQGDQAVMQCQGCLGPSPAWH